MLSRLIFTLIVLTHGVTLFAKEDSQQQLEDVKTEIQSLNQDVNKNKTSKVELFKQLKQQSRAVSKLNKTLLKLEQEIKQQNVELKRLEQQLQQQHSSHAKQLNALNQQIRSSYIHGQPSFLKILLNQNDPATLSRNTAYFHYFHQARQQQLATISNTLNNLTADQKIVFTAQKAQQERYAKQTTQQQALQKKTQQRQATLKLLDAKITDQDSRLAFLREQEKSLHSLFDSLSKPAKVNTNKTVSAPPSFAKRAGSL
ncbi:MAG: peptidase M23, partial [Methylophaga sp.]|nr:peptidase M23 [Methylophaga sp.]